MLWPRRARHLRAPALGRRWSVGNPARRFRVERLPSGVARSPGVGAPPDGAVKVMVTRACSGSARQQLRREVRAVPVERVIFAYIRARGDFSDCRQCRRTGRRRGDVASVARRQDTLDDGIVERDENGTVIRGGRHAGAGAARHERLTRTRVRRTHLGHPVAVLHQGCHKSGQGCSSTHDQIPGR